MASPLAPRYVSIDCPQGDLTLTLAHDSSFTLVLAHWDSTANQHTSREALRGHWGLRGTDLTLVSSSTELHYTRDVTDITLGIRRYRIDALQCKASKNPTFADSYMLVEQQAIDRAFKDA